MYVCMYVCMYIYIYIYHWVALLVERYSSNAASFVSCVFRRVKAQNTLLYDLPRLKKTCVRQIVLDK